MPKVKTKSKNCDESSMIITKVHGKYTQGGETCNGRKRGFGVTCTSWPFKQCDAKI